MPVDRWDRSPESYHSDGDESINSVEFARREAIIRSMGDDDYVVTDRDRMTERNRTLMDATDQERTFMNVTDRERNIINRSSPELRQSNRLKGDSFATQISINEECYNKTCPITLKKIKAYGIKLSDGQCYGAEAISNWYTSHENDAVQTTPFRAPYTDKDKTQINNYLQKRESRVGGGSRRKRISRRNTKTTRKTRKKLKTCKKRKPCKRR